MPSLCICLNAFEIPVGYCGGARGTAVILFDMLNSRRKFGRLKLIPRENKCRAASPCDACMGAGVPTPDRVQSYQQPFFCSIPEYRGTAAMVTSTV